LMIVLPIQILFMGFIQMVGVGSASMISRALGAEDYTKARKTLGNFFSLNLIISLTMTALGFIFLTPLLYLFGATESIFPYAYIYASIVLFGSVFLTISASSGMVIRAEGNAKYAMFMMLGSALTNCILDPIFIFYFDWGVGGAAWATVFSQVVGAYFALRFFFKKKSVIQIKINHLKPNRKIIREMVLIGFSSFIRQTIGTLTMIIVNNSLVAYGGGVADLALASFGILSKILMLSVMPIFGFVQGLQPIFGYNYGAHHYQRAILAITDSIKKVSVYCFLVFLILIFFGDAVIACFTSDQLLINFTEHAVHIMFLALPLVGFQEVAGGIYQSMGNVRKSFFVSLLRQFIALLPFMLILPLFFGLDGIFWSYPIADFISATVNFFLLRYEYQKLREHKIKITYPEFLPE